MGKKVTNHGKAGKKARRKAAQRKRTIRMGLIYFGLLALCLGCLGMMRFMNREPDRVNTWYAQNYGVPVASTSTGARVSAAQPAVPEADSAAPEAGPEDSAIASDDAAAEGAVAAPADTAEQAAAAASSAYAATETDAGEFAGINADAYAGENEDEDIGDAMPETEEADVDPTDVFGGSDRVTGEDAVPVQAVDAGIAQADNTATVAEANTAQADSAAAVAAAQQPATLDGPVSITITAAGDCTFGGSVNQDTYQDFKKAVDNRGYDYFFANVRRIFEADDLTILNLEGPLTDVGKGHGGSYCFRGDPEYVKIMTGSSVELCNVANNHSTDFGITGLKRTAEVLEQAGIGCCGYTKVYHTNIKGVRITALGFDKWQNNQHDFSEVIRTERPNCDLLIVNMHWGREKHYEPMAQQVKWGHAAIDAGADLVIGTHPHVYGGVELYKGKYIAYSLGNFCFGGNGNPSDKRCLIFQQTFVVSPGGTVTDGGINVIPCSVSSVTYTNDYQPTVLPAEEGLALLKKVARYSNFSKDGTLWMPNSYPEQIGVLGGAAQGNGQGPQAVSVTGWVTPEPNGLSTVTQADAGSLPPASGTLAPTAVPVVVTPTPGPTMVPSEWSNKPKTNLTSEDTEAIRDQIFQDQMQY